MLLDDLIQNMDIESELFTINNRMVSMFATNIVVSLNLTKMADFVMIATQIFVLCWGITTFVIIVT